MKIIYLVGAPASGKGTQAKHLVQSTDGHFVHISAGDIVRNLLRDKTNPLYAHYQSLMNKGQLLPDEVILKMIKETLLSLDRTYKDQGRDKIILLDGYPRTLKQAEQATTALPKPLGMIHLNGNIDCFHRRLLKRKDGRLDDNLSAINKRLEDYQAQTKPMIDDLKTRMPTITINSEQNVEKTAKELLQQLPKITEHMGSLSLFNTAYYLYQSKGKFTDFSDKISAYVGAQNIIVKRPFAKPLCFLQGTASVKTVLQSHPDLGGVYRQFSKAAGLNYDFTALNSHSQTKGPNLWRLTHQSLAKALKNQGSLIKQLIHKHLPKLVNAPTFALDKQFKIFYEAVWAELLFGNCVKKSNFSYLKSEVSTFMRRVFYQNSLKAFDFTGLSSWAISVAYKRQLSQIKANLKQMITLADSSLLADFKRALYQQNQQQGLTLSQKTLDNILLDNTFNLLFIPDFLEGALYETLKEAVIKQLDFTDKVAMEKAYQTGLNRSYLFPYRTRVLTKDVTLNGGVILPKGTTALLYIKNAGLYHSYGPRMCPGIGITQTFKEVLFEALSPIHLTVNRQETARDRKALSGDENVPVSKERFYLNWQLKKEAAQQLIPYHAYRGLRFYDVLAFNEKPLLRNLMIAKFCQTIKDHFKESSKLTDRLVIAAPEVRGLPIAAMVAQKLNLPLLTLRKEGGYKMEGELITRACYKKGYGQSDALELPKAKQQLLNDKEVILIDDGIASGQSLLACQKLIRMLGADSHLALAMVKHDYAILSPELKKESKIQTLFTLSQKPKAQILPFFKPGTKKDHIREQLSSITEAKLVSGN